MLTAKFGMAMAVRAGAGALVLLVAFLPGCGQESSTLAPITTSGSGAYLAGRVVADGNPLSGATVRLEPMEGELPATVAAALAHVGPGSEGSDQLGAASPSTATPTVRLASTDGQGRYVFDNVASGEYLLTASGRNHLAGSRHAVIAPLEPSAPETTFVDLALLPTGSLSGFAYLDTESDHRETIVHVEGTSVVAVTSANGSYLLRDVPIGTRSVSALHPGYLSASAVATLGGAGDSVQVAAMTLRINGNIAPTATANTVLPSTIYGSAELGGSGLDVDGTIIRYQWDFEDDGIFDWSSPTTATTGHIYPTQGIHRARLRVTDDKGAVGYAVTSVMVYDAVYMASTGSNSNSGLRETPVATLARAYEVAGSVGGGIEIRIAQGIYFQGIIFQNEVNVVGGFNATTWTRAAGDRSLFLVGATPAVADGLGQLLVVGLEIRALIPDAAGNIVALELNDCTADVMFTDCRFTAANAANGTPGTSGSDGVAIPGEDGGNGLCGFYNCNGGPGGITPSSPVGDGGTGGDVSDDGLDGHYGTHGTPGGAHGVGATSPGVATNGQPGANAVGLAASGDHGPAATWPGAFSGTAWIANAGNDGSDGETSVGGGGGGGGGQLSADSYYRNPGGGGGAGGTSTGGLGGQGGRPAGSSFALVSHLTPGNFPLFTNCQFDAGDGGNGGSGGFGGTGAPPAPGGAGGQGADFSGPPGADGGAGGSSASGGKGGGGSGAPGGLSYSVALTGFAEPEFVNCTFTYGAAGSGGNGGYRSGTLSQAPSGPDGSAGAIYDDVQ